LRLGQEQLAHGWLHEIVRHARCEDGSLATEHTIRAALQPPAGSPTRTLILDVPRDDGRPNRITLTSHPLDIENADNEAGEPAVVIILQPA